jgi:hypothetical protein
MFSLSIQLSKKNSITNIVIISMITNKQCYTNNKQMYFDLRRKHTQYIRVFSEQK